MSVSYTHLIVRPCRRRFCVQMQFLEFFIQNFRRCGNAGSSFSAKTHHDKILLAVKQIIYHLVAAASRRRCVEFFTLLPAHNSSSFPAHLTLFFQRNSFYLYYYFILHIAIFFVHFSAFSTFSFNISLFSMLIQVSNGYIFSYKAGFGQELSRCV